MSDLQTRYLEWPTELYPAIAATSMEAINLEAVLNLLKGTEHFLTDIHGEYEAFSHVPRNGSGAVRRKVSDVLGDTLSSQNKQILATPIYYPREKMTQIPEYARNQGDRYKTTLYQLIEVSERAAGKYARSKVRRTLSQELTYTIEGLITEKVDTRDKESYYNVIIQTIIQIGRVGKSIVAPCELIQRLIVDRLYILRDIYNRGPGPRMIMDKLITYHFLDIQWGNYDVLWMGTAAGQEGCIANVIRVCARYGNLGILKDGYGVNPLSLAALSLDTYGSDPCACSRFREVNIYSPSEIELNIRMHKAMFIIQFKAEGQIIREHPELYLDGRNLLHHADLDRGIILLGGGE